MAKLSFQHAYKVPDQMENVEELATAIIFTHDLESVVRESYS